MAEFAPSRWRAHRLRRVGIALGFVSALAALALAATGPIGPVVAGSIVAKAFVPGALALIGTLCTLGLAPLGASLILIAGLAVPSLLGTGASATMIFVALLAAALLACAGSFLALSRAIDKTNAAIGRWISWLVVAAVLVSALNAIVRKVFDTSSNAFLEAQWVMFAIVFLLCAPWTLIQNEHIRIDIINQMLPGRVRRGIDLAGHALFLMPFALVMIFYGLPFFFASYAVNEQSFNANGLPQWPAKSLIAIGFILLAIQGVSEIVKEIAILAGRMNDPHAGEATHHLIDSEMRAALENLPPAETRP